MNDLDRIIAQRVEARKAEAHLRSILEMYTGHTAADSDNYDIMEVKIEEFLDWLWHSSPIA